MQINKRGGEKLLSIWWFAVLSIVGASIVIAVLMHYSAEINVKGIEAGILSERISACLSDNGIMKKEFSENNFDNKFDLMQKCGFAIKVFGADSNFFAKIMVTDSGGHVLKNIVIGNSAFEKDCQITQRGTITAKNYPVCTTLKKTGYYVEKGEMKSVSLSILTASNQGGRKVSVLK